MTLRTYTCPHCGANLMIEIGRKRTICEYCDSELYIDEIISDIKRDRNRDDREDVRRSTRDAYDGSSKGTYAGGSQGNYAGGSQGTYAGGSQGSYDGGSQGYTGDTGQSGYSGGAYENRTQSQTYAPGYDAPQTSMAYVSPKNRLLALLLCVFLGIFGVHRFYVGKIGTGLLYFFTMGIFGFGWMIDIVMIAVGAFRDSRGLPVRDWGM